MNKTEMQYDLLAPLHTSTAPEFVSGKGAELFDAQGRRYLSFNELSCCLGAGNAHYIEVMQRAVSELQQAGAANPYKARLLERLMQTTHGDFERVHLTASGSEAVEWAVKLAKKMTGRSEVISFWNSIHGRTHLSASMSGLPKRKTGYGPLESGVLLTPYPDCGHCPFRCDSKNCGFYCLDFLSEQVTYGSAQDIAAVVIELSQGAAHACPPPGYLKALREWTSRRGILLIFDEIQSGMGRTGVLYRYQEEGVVPDFLLLGKGLANGMHMAGFLMRGAVEKEWLPALAGGSGDSLLTCAAACAMFDELLDGGLLEHIALVGAQLKQGLEDCVRRYGAAVRVRGNGFALTLECADSETAGAVHAAMDAKGYLLGRMGAYLVLKPPYSLSAGQADEVCRAFDETFAKL